jgi:hypothetical protein
MTETLIAMVEPLQRNPWAGWKTNTRVVVKSFDDDRDGTPAYVQPDLTYVVEAQDQRLARFQEVGGKRTRQEFPISPEGGLQKAAVHLDGQPAEFTIDGVALPTTLHEQTLRWIGPDNGGQSTTRSWVLRDRPQILLKRQEGNELWLITSVRTIRRIGGQSYRCLETVQRSSSVDGYYVITQYLSAEVPGHLVEQIQRHYKSSAPRPVLVIHERVVAVEIPHG